MNRNTILLTSLAMFFTSVHAQTPSQTQVTQTPSQDAIKICADKIVGDICSFVNAEGTSINGKCSNTQDNGQGKMVCVPIK